MILHTPLSIDFGLQVKINFSDYCSYSFLYL